MKLDYRRDIHRQYIIIRPGEDAHVDSFRLKMMIGNEMPGFAPCTFESMNAEPMLYYDVTGLQPLSVCCGEGKADKLFLNKLISALLSGFETIEKYLLEPDYIVLRPETVFINVRSEEIVFVCFPFEKKDLGEQLKAFSGFLLSRASEEPDDIKAAYRFYSVCSGNQLTAEALIEVLRSLRGPGPEEGEEIRDPEEEKEKIFYDSKAPSERGKKKKERIRRVPFGSVLEKIRSLLKGTKKTEKSLNGWEEYQSPIPAQSPVPCQKPVPAQRLVPGQEPAPAQEPGPIETPDEDDFSGETICISSFEEQPEETAAWLVPADIFSGESIELKKETCMIGRGAAPGMIRIEDRAVSRKHACLVRSGGTYALSDMGSRNGTYVNGMVLAAGESIELADGDVVKFADVEYHFRLTDKAEVNYTMNVI